MIKIDRTMIATTQKLIKLGFARCPHNQYKYEYLIYGYKNCRYTPDFWKKFTDRVCPNKKCEFFGRHQDVIHCFDHDEAFFCDCGSFKEPPIIKIKRCLICDERSSSWKGFEKAHNHLNIKHKTENWDEWEDYKAEYFNKIKGDK